MKDNQAKYPQLRFKGFTDPWDKRYLGDYVVDYTEKTTQENQFPVLTSSQQQGIVLQSEYFSDRQVTTDENIGYFVLPRGYFTYRSRSDNNIFVFNRNDIIDKGIISYFYPVFGLINADSNFFLRRINNGLNRQLAIAAEGTGQHVLSLKKFKKMETRFPSLPEQKKIGEFLECLDDLITVNQRKLAKLKELKQGYLQKMFPKNGSKFPQLRFAGFADAWEQRKVSELADRYDNLRVPITASERVAGETPYYGANGIQDYVEGFTHNGEFVLVAEDGANDLQNYPVQYVDGKVWVNNHAHVLQAKEERVDNKFLTNALKHTNIEPYLVGGGRAKLNADVMMKINFKVPTLPEQVQIGKFFDNLDHLITLHQRKLDLLKEQKKGFLQKMFV